MPERSEQPTGGAGGSKPRPGARGGLQPGLHIVATPIGNLGDLSDRARRTLAEADVVACEDTRVTGGLLQRIGARAALMPYHEHNAERMRPQLLERLRAGAVVALVSDAGTPLVSDPGYKLVRDAAEIGIPVVPVPGPSALLAALMVAGLPTDRFLFAGFLPSKAKARRDALRELAAVPATLVFYEAVHRLAESLAAMAEELGPRPAAVCRELTKLHEEVRRGALDTLADQYAAAGAPKGEVVVVVGPPVPTDAPAAADLDGLLRAALKEQSVRDAAATVAAATGLKKRIVYARALELARDPLSGGGQGDGGHADRR